MSHHLFFPQTTLDILADAGRLDIDDNILIIRPEGLRYRAREAVRIVREVTSGEDDHQLVATVRPREELILLDAEILGDSMLIDEAAYDVVPGLLGAPIADEKALKTPSDELDTLDALHEVDA